MIPLNNLLKALRFCFITDDDSPDLCPVKQVEIAIKAGATMIRYRSRAFTPRFYREAETIRDLCKSNSVPLIISANVLLAKALTADGIHLEIDDEKPETAKNVLGEGAIIGVSLSGPDEIDKIDIKSCDYVEASSLFKSRSCDVERRWSFSGLISIINKSHKPVIASGGVHDKNAESCFYHGAAGVAVKSFISKGVDPALNARQISRACKTTPRYSLALPWNDEFNLLDKLLYHTHFEEKKSPHLKVSPGDDAALFSTIERPVVTTDTQREGVHFKLSWQTPEEIGNKAVEAAFSDLAASYAEPVALFVNLAIPSYISDKIVEGMYIGIRKALLKHNASLGGGNISRADRLSVDLFAIGQGHCGIFPARCHARPGDGLYCSGPVGLARAGLESLRRKDAEFKELIEKFISPKARFDAAKILAENGVKCVIDISDGISGDAKHIAKASNITIKLDLLSSAFDTIFLSFCKKYNLSPKQTALTGGEDYELLFACSESTFERIKKKLPGAFKVGICMEFNGKYIAGVPSDVSSFQHGER